MALGNFCDKRIMCIGSFSLPYICTHTECFKSHGNDEITYIDSNGKHIVINSDTELNISEETEHENPIDSTDFKDAFLTFLRNELT